MYAHSGDEVPKSPGDATVTSETMNSVLRRSTDHQGQHVALGATGENHVPPSGASRETLLTDTSSGMMISTEASRELRICLEKPSGKRPKKIRDPRTLRPGLARVVKESCFASGGSVPSVQLLLSPSIPGPEWNTSAPMSYNYLRGHTRGVQGVMKTERPSRFHVA